jgi:uncharacterized repeat protein (TIGR01451 family)
MGDPRVWRGLLLSVLLMAGAALWNPRPGAAQPTPATVTVTKVVTGINDDNSAFNGDTIAYTIIVNNNTSATLTDMLLLDVLPLNVLDNVQCQDAPGVAKCELINEVNTIPEPLGGTITITTTRQISWTVASVAPSTSLQRSFTARVIGQADGATFTNVAYANYMQSGQQRTQSSNEVNLTVRLRIEQGGATTLSNTPTWFSQDVGGTLSMDWADFDGDGDLDLALGSTLGISVYRNVAGRLELFWSITGANTDRPAFGVRWADVDGDRVPEVIAVGAVAGDLSTGNNMAQMGGVNYVYKYDPTTGATNRRFQELSNFTTSRQMVRVEAGDFDGDGATDLIVSTNAINAECPVQRFVNDGSGNFTLDAECISRAATAALKPVDFDNDGDLDLTAGLFPSQVQMLVNNNGDFGGASMVIESSVMFLPYDFAWGDYDGDGWLDLAAAYPLMREARIYRNVNGTGFAGPISLRTNVFLTPYALDWGDFSGDGKLDLAIADSPPIIYSFVGGTTSSAFKPFFLLGDDVVSGQVWSLRAVDANNDGDIDLTLSDRDGPSLVISNFRPPLNTALQPLTGVPPFGGQSPSSSVAWADADGDDDLDLIFGAGPAGPAALNSKIYYNDMGAFPVEAVRAYNGFGPHIVAVGDADGDGDIDVAIGSSTEQRLHKAGDFLAPFWSIAEEGDKTPAWGDADGDVDLDLLVATKLGQGGHVELFLNDGTGYLGTASVWRADLAARPQAVAWGDYDQDGFLDFALGIDGHSAVYHNERDNRFSLYWSTPTDNNTRAVAWGDYDGDGDLDLMTGNFGSATGPGEANVLYDNHLTAAKRDFVAVLTTSETLHTTSLDWGDWDNDGDLDLAVGNYGEVDQIYVNSGSATGAPSFFWLWSSNEKLNTTGIAWGDRDGDGDLDLAISQDGAALNGIYTNNLVVPSHLTGAGVGTLINPPLYVYTSRPGATAPAYAYSSAELLSGPKSGPVDITYRLFNPAAQTGVSVAASTALTASVLAVEHEFSVDGGGTWRPATRLTKSVSCTCAADTLNCPNFSTQPEAQTCFDLCVNQGKGDIHGLDDDDDGLACEALPKTISPLSGLVPITDAFGTGLQGTFIWDAIKDQAIGDNARFRVQVVQADASGPVQRATAATVSPPFRVRAITCVWPEEPAMRALPSLPDPGGIWNMAVDANTTIRFTGKIASGTGAIFYAWDFGDGQIKLGQVVEQSFTNGTYTVRMAVSGTPCPETRERATTVILKVGTGQPDLLLPMITVGTSAVTTTTTTVATAAVVTGTLPSAAPQVTVLGGDVQANATAVWLRWEPPAGDVAAYHVYRGGRDDEAAALIAELPADATAYLDESAGCDQRYYVTTLAAGVESLPSAAVYYGPLCQDGGQ